MVDETSVIEGSPEGEKKKKIKKTKLLPPIIFVIVVIILIVIKLIYKDVNNIWFFAIGGGVGVVCLLIFLSSNFIEMWKQRGKEELEIIVPPAITYGEAEKERDRILLTKEYGVRIGRLFKAHCGAYGENNKQMIFYNIFKAYNNNLLFFFGLNMHFWQTNKDVTVLGEYCGEKCYEEIYKKYKLVIDQALKRLPTDTEKTPNIKTIRRTNQALGYEEEVVEKIHPDSKLKEKQKEDLE